MQWGENDYFESQDKLKDISNCRQVELCSQRINVQGTKVHSTKVFGY